MKRSTEAVPARRKGPRTARGQIAASLRPPVKPKDSSSSPETREVVLSVSPFIPSVDQDLECCLLGVRDCLTKMRQTEITDRAIRAVDRALKLL